VNNIRCVDPLNSSGWAGSDAGAWVNSALADTPNGGTVAIAPGTYTVSTQIVLTRNSSVECSPNNATVLRAGSAFNLASLFLASGINHFRLAGCVADGNRAGNSNQFPLLLTVNSSNGEVRDNHFQNNLSRTILVTSGSSHIQIDNNEVDHYGLPIPASVGGEAIAIVPTGGGAGVSHIQVSNNIVHDGNLGIAVYPDSTTTSPVVDISIARNRVYATANDGILAFSTNSQGGLLTGIRIEDNEVYCTGWPAERIAHSRFKAPLALRQSFRSPAWVCRAQRSLEMCPITMDTETVSLAVLVSVP
jgi:hypothetical protein